MHLAAAAAGAGDKPPPLPLPLLLLPGAALSRSTSRTPFGRSSQSVNRLVAVGRVVGNGWVVRSQLVLQ